MNVKVFQLPIYFGYGKGVKTKRTKETKYKKC
jgi:hypothetical protein